MHPTKTRYLTARSGINCRFNKEITMDRFQLIRECMEQLELQGEDHTPEYADLLRQINILMWPDMDEAA